MKKRRLILALSCIFLLGSVFAEGQQEEVNADYYVISESEGNARYTQEDVPLFVDAGLEGWTLLNNQASGIDFYIFKLAPDAAEYPNHTSPDKWFGYVLSGSGELFLGDIEGKEIDSIEFSKGDFLIFEPETMHGWRNGSKETQLLFLKAMN